MQGDCDPQMLDTQMEGTVLERICPASPQQGFLCLNDTPSTPPHTHTLVTNSGWNVLSLSPVPDRTRTQMGGVTQSRTAAGDGLSAT